MHRTQDSEARDVLGTTHAAPDTRWVILHWLFM